MILEYAKLLMSMSMVSDLLLEKVVDDKIVDDDELLMIMVVAGS